jgi:hypothetical protein
LRIDGRDEDVDRQSAVVRFRTYQSRNAHALRGDKTLFQLFVPVIIYIEIKYHNYTTEKLSEKRIKTFEIDIYMIIL